jgi:hypothetical protein
MAVGRQRERKRRSRTFHRHHRYASNYLTFSDQAYLLKVPLPPHNNATSWRPSLSHTWLLGEIFQTIAPCNLCLGQGRDERHQPMASMFPSPESPIQVSLQTSCILTDTLTPGLFYSNFIGKIPFVVIEIISLFILIIL